MDKRTVGRIAAGAALALAFTGMVAPAEAGDGFTVRRVAIGGETDDLSSGEVLQPEVGTPVGIDDKGCIVFSANIEDSVLGPYAGQAVFLEENGQLNVVFRTFTTVFGADGTTDLGSIETVDSVLMAPNGEMAATVWTDMGARALLSWSEAKGLRTAVAEGHAFDCPLDRLPGFRFDMAAFNQGLVAYEGTEDDSGTDAACDFGKRAGVHLWKGDFFPEKLIREGDSLDIPSDPDPRTVFSGLRDVALEPNGHAGFVATISGAGLAEALVLHRFADQPRTVLATDDAVPGSPGESVTRFHHALVDDGFLAKDGFPRIACALESHVGDTHVIDQDQGPPLRSLLASGDVRSGIEFVGGPGTRLLSAGRNRLVIHAPVVGSDPVLAAALLLIDSPTGVWRHNPLLDGPAQLELVTFAGAAVPGVPGAAIERIAAVYANAEGDVAVLVQFQQGAADAWLIEENGVLKLAVRTGDKVPDGKGGEVVLERLGNVGFTELYGSGEAGRGVRFNTAGSLVFTASTDRGPYYAGVFVVDRGSGPTTGPSPANIRAVQKGKTLYVTGTEFADRMHMIIEENSVTLSGLDGTTIDDVPQPPPFKGIVKVIIKMLDGDNEVSIEDLRNTANGLQTLFAVFGRDSDRLEVENLILRLRARIDMGSSPPGGKDVVILDGVQSESVVEIIERKDGNLDAHVTDGDIEKALRLNTKKAREVSLRLEHSDVGTFYLNGNEVTVTSDGCRSRGPVSISGDGEDFDLDLIDLDAPVVKLNSRAETTMVSVTGMPRIGSLNFNFRSDDVDLDVQGDGQGATSIKGKAAGAGTADLRFSDLSAAAFELLLRKYRDASVAATDSWVERSARWRVRSAGSFRGALDTLHARGRFRMAVNAGSADVSVTGSRFDDDSRFDIGGGDATVQIDESQFAGILKLQTERGNDTVSLNDLFLVACQLHTGAGDDTAHLFGEIEAAQLLARLGSGNDTLTGDVLLSGLSDAVLDGQSGAGDRIDAVIRGYEEGPILQLKGFEIRP